MHDENQCCYVDDGFDFKKEDFNFNQPESIDDSDHEIIILLNQTFFIQDYFLTKNNLPNLSPPRNHSLNPFYYFIFYYDCLKYTEYCF